jgi:hypothetical protein
MPPPEPKLKPSRPPTTAPHQKKTVPHQTTTPKNPNTSPPPLRQIHTRNQKQACCSANDLSKPNQPEPKTGPDPVQNPNRKTHRTNTLQEAESDAGKRRPDAGELRTNAKSNKTQQSNKKQ